MSRAKGSTLPARPPAARQDRVTTRREIITPEIATVWLERNTANRNVVQSTVDRYARDMRAGRWHYTGDPIQFGISGTLLNGQHRLWACLQADVSFESAVVRGIVNEEEVRDVIDTGMKRTLAHALQIHGEKDALLLAAIVNTCWRYDLDRCKGPYPTHEEGLHWLQENPDVREATKVARAVYKDLRAQASSIGTAYYLNRRVDGEAAAEFWELARYGEGLAGGDPILAYRRWVISALSKRDKPLPNVWLAYNLKTMNLWRAGRRIRILSMTATEPMPETWSA